MILPEGRDEIRISGWSWERASSILLNRQDALAASSVADSVKTPMWGRLPVLASVSSMGQFQLGPAKARPAVCPQGRGRLPPGSSLVRIRERRSSECETADSPCSLLLVSLFY